MPNIKDRIDNVRDKAVEVGVYLPLGAYGKVRDQIEDLDTKKVRRFYGRLVDVGQDRVEPLEKAFRSRVRRFERQAEESVDDMKSVARKTSNKAQKTTRQAANEVKKTSRKTAARTEAAADAVAPKMPRVAAPQRASDLPIKGYASLTASEIAAATKGLTQTDLARVYKYEKANENRSTVLEAVEAKFVDLPIPSYDALNADEIVGRLDSLNESELKLVRRYENDTKARATVLDKVDSLLS